jgi:hypothetical protein
MAISLGCGLRTCPRARRRKSNDDTMPGQPRRA